MNSFNNPMLKAKAQALRNNMTPEEKCLWFNYLKDLPVTVNRQKVIGSYIVDFYCAEKSAVIEIDGEYHEKDFFKYHDRVRENYLKQFGLKILRYSNYDVINNFEKVCNDIANKLDLV